MKIKVDKITGKAREDDNNIITTYNTENSLRIWKAALAKLKSGTSAIFNMVCLGDSLTEGQGTTTYITQGYVGLIRNKLKALYGDVGTGVISNFYPSNSPLWSMPSWTVTNNTGYGITQYSKYANTSGLTATLTFNGTGIRIITVKGSICGKMNIQIDGGGTTVYDMNNASLINPYTFDITGLADSSHTITITTDCTGGKYIYLFGAIPLKGTAGMRVHNCARTGILTASASTYPAVLASEIDIYAPVLTTIAFGANDYTGNVTIDAFKANVQAMITRAKTFGDVLLIANGLRTEAGAYPQSQYAMALKSLATLNNCAFIDINSRWNNSYTYANTTLGLMFDGVHPNLAGHQDVATAILNVLLEER